MAVPDRIELTGIDTVTGTAREVGGRLNRIKDRQAVAFVLPRASVQQRDAIAETVEALVHITAGRKIRRNREVLESLVNAFMPAIEAPEATRREARMMAEARAEVLRSAEWLTAAQVAELAHLSQVNPNAQPSRWKRDDRIFSIKPAGSVERFPAYGLDSASGYRPVKELAEIIKLLRDQKDGWGLAYWFASINSFLGGRQPQDVLQEDPRSVVAAAADEADAIVHG